MRISDWSSDVCSSDLVSDDPQPVLKAAATDGHRLARVTVPRPDGAEGMPDVIIPRKCVGELRKLLDEIDGSVGVSLSTTKIRFDLGQEVLTSKLIDGTFPDYSTVHPHGNQIGTARGGEEVCHYDKIYGVAGT